MARIGCLTPMADDRSGSVEDRSPSPRSRQDRRRTLEPPVSSQGECAPTGLLGVLRGRERAGESEAYPRKRRIQTHTTSRASLTSVADRRSILPTKCTLPAPGVGRCSALARIHLGDRTFKLQNPSGGPVWCRYVSQILPPRHHLGKQFYLFLLMAGTMAGLDDRVRWRPPDLQLGPRHRPPAR